MAVISLSPDLVCKVIGEELSQFGCPAPAVKLASSERSVSFNEHPASNEYLLQRWSTKWNTFVDVHSVKDIKVNTTVTIGHRADVDWYCPTTQGEH